VVLLVLALVRQPEWPIALLLIEVSLLVVAIRFCLPSLVRRCALDVRRAGVWIAAGLALTVVAGWWFVAPTPGSHLVSRAVCLIAGWVLVRLVIVRLSGRAVDLRLD
jgi:hypothetical protein